MVTVTNETEFRNAVSGLEPEILVENDISLTATVNIGYAVTIKGEAGVSLFWASPSASRPYMLVITASGDLTIESLILDAEGRSGTLVHVNGGKFTMDSGAVLKNIYSRTSQNAVLVGSMTSAVGGSFIMNHGLITGVDSSAALFCGGNGTVVMNNDAAIHDNLSSGINMASTLGLRSSLTMSGASRISNNQSRQGASGGIVMEGDVVMGVNEGDAPAVTGNHDDVFAVGGLLMTDNSTLTMRYGATISDNHTVEYGGGVTASSGTTVSMYDNASIKNNTCTGAGAGLVLLADSSANMEGNSEISGNTCGGNGGGLHLQSGSVLNMKGNASVHGNNAANGAGIYLYNSSANLGDGSSPEIYGNEATGKGGGVYISAGSAVNLTGQTVVRDNKAAQGGGIYKEGGLNLSGSPKILDGLFFDCPDTDAADEYVSAQKTGALHSRKLRVSLDSAESIVIGPFFETATARSNETKRNYVQAYAAADGAYCDNVPVIADTLTDAAYIQLESSGHVSPVNVPLVIADKAPGYAQLLETDRAAWNIPSDFAPGHTVYLNGTSDQVLIGFETYSITYKNLFGAENPNPVSYDISELPIVLSEPGKRAGYVFTGWYDENGLRITEISAEMAGDLTLTAVWEKLFLSFDGNARCVCNIPKPIPAGPDETVRIPFVVPCRPEHRFICWNIPDSGSGKVYFPGDIIPVSHGSVTLCAKWQPICCSCKKKPF